MSDPKRAGKQVDCKSSLASSQPSSLLSTDYDLLTPTTSWSSAEITPAETPNTVIGGLRRVHKLTPLEYEVSRTLAFVKPAATLPEPAKPSKVADKSSEPVPIPGAAPLPPAKIAAVAPFHPAKSEVKVAAIVSAAPPAVSASWAARKQYFPLHDLTKQPASQKPKRPAKPTATKRTVVAVGAHTNGIYSANAAGTGKEAGAVDMAWHYRFKRKWIREELFARRMDFPDEDPGYNDPWQEAMGFISALGPNGALQVAFLNSSPKSASAASPTSADSDDELFGEDADALLFEEEGDSSKGALPYPAPCKTAGLAAQLVRMHRSATMA